MLRMKCEEDGNNRVYYLQGEIDTVRSKQFASGIDTEGCMELIFDMTELDYITSSGIRVLMAINRTMREKGGRISVRNVNEVIDEIFEMTGFYMVIL